MKIFFIKYAAILCIIKILILLCRCVDVVAFSSSKFPPKHKSGRLPVKYEEYRPVKPPTLRAIDRYWLLNDQTKSTPYKVTVQLRVYEDEKDSNIKQKIAMLVEQSMNDVQRQMKDTENMRKDNKDEAPYKVGFILSMLKKSKNVMEELFNVAVKHKNEWKALEHMKIFELIFHTNVDTTNLLRQLINVHMKHTNSTEGGDRRRLILF